MKRIAALLLSVWLLLLSVPFVAAANTTDDVPSDAVQYAQDVLLDRVADLIESGFTSSEPDAYRYRNAKPGDTYHLSGGIRLFTFTEIEPAEGARPNIADIISPTEGWLFTVDNTAGTPVAIIELSRNEDGSFGFQYGDDAYAFDKCLCLMRSLLASDSVKEEPVLIADHTYALLVRDAAGTERIMPAPSLECEAEAVLDVTSLKQLPTGEELLRALQNRKRETDSSPEILYGGSVFQDLVMHPDGNDVQTNAVFPLRLTVCAAVCAAAAAAVAICAVYRKKKKRA